MIERLLKAVLETREDASEQASVVDFKGGQPMRVPVLVGLSKMDFQERPSVTLYNGGRSQYLHIRLIIVEIAKNMAGGPCSQAI
jgi:hypothetical protein